ncbi:MAG: tyrosine-type recombinase/integrase [Candidatus Rokubacteria bacterium]|nr:tyrosine-type recombinase/integrase [Candidatus Rokubacteria bacterium]
MRPLAETGCGRAEHTRGRALCARAAQYRFAFWRHQAGLRRAYSIHSLRHTFATLLYGATKDLTLVGRALGHRDIRSTQRYAHLGDDALAGALDALWGPPRRSEVHRLERSKWLARRGRDFDAREK